MSTHTHTRILECCHQELSLGSEQLVGAATASSRDVNEDRIDSSSLWKAAAKAATGDFTVETSSLHSKQLNQGIIHAEPLAWATLKA